MGYEVLHIDDCPSWEVASRRLREALVITGHGDDMVDVRAVRSRSMAERIGFPGSPTVRADGVDLFPAPDGEGALTCRIYSTPAGLAGSPTVEQLVDAIRSHDAAALAACSCCGRIRARSKMHSLRGGDAYVCRRCGFWIAFQWRGDQSELADR